MVALLVGLKENEKDAWLVALKAGYEVGKLASELVSLKVEKLDL